MYPDSHQVFSVGHGMEKAPRIDPLYNPNSSSLGLFSRKKSVIEAYKFQPRDPPIKQKKVSAYAVRQSLTFFEGWFSSGMVLTLKVFRLRPASLDLF